MVSSGLDYDEVSTIIALVEVIDTPNCELDGSVHNE